MDESEKIYYREEQRFSQRWLWMVLAIIAVLFTVGFVKQIVFKVPFGDKPMSDYQLLIIWVISSIVMPGLFYLIVSRYLCKYIQTKDII